MKHLLRMILIAVYILMAPAYAHVPSSPKAYVLTIDSAIGPAISTYIAEGINAAEKAKAAFVILQIDTPGGLDSSMREIIKNMMNASIPIISYVSPKGARAASAGTFIIYASQIAAMAPGTNIGAASPISLLETNKTKATKNTKKTAKVTQDAVAYIRSLAELRNRNKVFATDAVKNAKSISAEQALQSKVIDLIATNMPDLIKKLNNQIIYLDNNSKHTLDTKNINLYYFQPTWKIKFLSIITTPSIAYILLIIGIYGLLFEFFNPGAILPGVTGGLALILALYALHLLPISYAGLSLVILGIMFFVGEVFVPSFGALGLGGTIAFILGSIMLIKTDSPWYGIPWYIITFISLLNVIILSSLVIFILKTKSRPKISGQATILGHTGKVITVNNDATYWIIINGERWRCRSAHTLKLQDKVIVIAINELDLTVDLYQTHKDKGV